MGRALTSCLMGQWHVLGFYYRWFIFLGWNLILQHSHIYKIFYIYIYFLSVSRLSTPHCFCTHLLSIYTCTPFLFWDPLLLPHPLLLPKPRGLKAGLDGQTPPPTLLCVVGKLFWVFFVFFSWIKKILLTKRRKIVPIYKIICYIIIVYKNYMFFLFHMCWDDQGEKVVGRFIDSGTSPGFQGRLDVQLGPGELESSRI